MEVREMTNDQLLERLEELRGIGENPGERTAEDVINEIYPELCEAIVVD